MRRTVIALLLTALAASAAAAPGVTEIDKYHRVDARVSTGAQPTLAQVAALSGEGFRTIVNLREQSEFHAEAEEQASRDAGIRYVWIPVRTAEPRPEQVDAFLKALDDPSVYPVFIHCGTGNRVGAFWLIRRVLVDGWTFENAEREAREIGMRSSNLKEFAAEYIRQHPRKAS